MTSPEHPHILISAIGRTGTTPLSRLDAARAGTGCSRRLWDQVFEVAARRHDPITPFDPLPGRSEADVTRGNRDYLIVDAAGQRVCCAALVGAVTQDRTFVEAALRQMASLFDDTVWEEWQDIFHRQTFDLDADLRTGQLARDLALAWDWLYPLLTADERRWVVDGIDRRGIQPYLRAVDAGAWWVGRMNNWTTVIVGGLGICGMALAEAHPQSTALIDMARPIMRAYMDHYGPEGEFNENPAYANSSFLPALFFSALRSYEATPDVPAPIAALHQHAYWCVYATAPPGHLVSFGDGGPAYPALTSFLPAVAAATQDSVLQWVYEQYGEPARFPVWELLWYDAQLAPQTPADLPLGRAFPAHSGLISSRTSWEPDSTPCVVFSKAGHGGVNHTHPDAGQIEIHAHAVPLIVDLGSVPYPAKEARSYYHFSSDGHNQLTVGGRPQAWDNDSRRARTLAHEFDDERGGWWRIDLTELHDGVESVSRTVVHLHPGIVVIVDQARLTTVEQVRLRWHPATEPALTGSGRFHAVRDGRRVDAWIGHACGTPAELQWARHEYRPPFDRDRIGNPMPQRREPYIDACAEADSIRFVSLFSVGWEDGAQPWEHAAETWTCGGGGVQIANDVIRVAGEDRAWELPLF
ncbi:MAG: hypothetical protein GKR89_13875 [Candidatus Latescibacteria bacterium]|nr:hypothetical protein [Candidatus Latescibacterota bacterium]